MEKKHIRRACLDLTCVHFGIKDYTILPNHTIIIDSEPLEYHDELWRISDDIIHTAGVMFHSVRRKYFKSVCSKVFGRNFHKLPLVYPWAEDDIKSVKVLYKKFSTPEHIAKVLALAKKYEAETKHWHTKKKYA